MNLESVSLAASSPSVSPKAEDRIGEARKQKEKLFAEPQVAEKVAVAPEELLDQIKGLSENGAYGVRFETHDKLDELIVQLVDQDTEELIRQIPADEILQMRAALDGLRGNLIDTAG